MSTVVVGCRLILVAVTIALATGCAGSSSHVPANPPNLSGTWLLNPEESETFADRFDPRDRRGETVSLEERERMRRQVEAGILAFRAFRIDQTDSTVALLAAEGTNRVYYPDGRELQRRIDGLGNVTVKARWSRGRLQVRSTMVDGIEIEETYELSDDAERLLVRFRVRGAARSFDFRRVYERVGDAG